jgi:tetratricopeptide (TPR) repeat protein
MDAILTVRSNPVERMTPLNEKHFIALSCGIGRGTVGLEQGTKPHMRPAMRSRLFLTLSVCFLCFFIGVGAQQPGAKKPEPKKLSGPLHDAQQRLLHGNYEEAREGFAAVAKADPKAAPAAVAGIAESYRLVGDYEKALETLDTGVKEMPKNATLHAARGDLLYQLGRWDDAEKDADAAIATDKNHVQARWTKAKILRERGKIEDAREAMRLIIRYYNAADITDPAELIQVSEAAAEFARWANNSKQFAFILNEVIKDALKHDPNYWPVEQLAGELLLEKYNRPDAIDAFDNALKVNPKAADPLVGKARAALVKFDLKDADAYADQALKQNPKHPAALRVKADIQLIAGDYAAAEKELRKAMGVNPRDSATLGRLAAIHLMRAEAAEFAAIVKTVEGFDTKPGLFYHELASVLEERKQYAKAEEYYKKASELRPLLAGPRTGLGMLQLRLGNEAEGRKLLDAAFKADPFNVRVSNSRKVLDHLDKYETIQTPHYTLKYDPNTDRLLADWLAEYLEQTHTELKGQFGFEPPGKVLIEVFNSHEMFSGRTVGLPDLHTIGACTGRVVAMASPKAKGVAKPFNWGRVMRHELTHIFNLAQTDFQCPHWLTEGLAVQNEKMNRSPMWSQVLRARFHSDTLLNLDTIMLGFVRPKGPDEWSLAYCQSQLYVEYLIQTYGQASVGKLLNEFKAGKDTGTALKAACGVEKAVFEKGYKEYVTAVVKAMGSAPAEQKAAEKPMTFDELQEAVEKNPDDLDLSARLADQLLRRNKASEAKKLADAVLGKEPGHPIASIVKARLLRNGGDDEGALGVLEAALKAKPNDPKLLIAIGRVYLERKEFAEAAKVFEKGRQVAPLEADWLEQLIKLYKELKETEKLNAALAEMISYDPDELDGRVRLAKWNLEAGKFAVAEEFARDALLIDVAHTDAKDILIEALRKQNKNTEADKIEKRYAK